MQHIVTDSQMDALTGAIHAQGAELAGLRKDAERYRKLQAQATKKTTRSITATIRFSPENLAAAEKVAALTGRTVSSLAEYALVLFMRQNYPLAYNPDAKLVLKLDEAPKLSALHRVAMGEGCVTGFFFADAVAALGDFERASRHLAALIKVGAVRCTTVRLGFSTHDFYAVA